MEDNRKRNMERRRETSRYAARDRRGKEADIFQELRDCVPIVEEGTVTHLDRIALLRVAATICRLRKTAGNVLETKLGAEIPNQVWTEETIAECLDGFVMIVDSDSSILYVTESVALYLGLTQTDLTGRALKDFLHPADYDQFDKLTRGTCANGGVNGEDVGANLVLRMKTVISPRGRCLNLKSALYKPVSFLVHSKISTGGHVSFMQGITIPAGQGTVNANASAMTKYTESPTGAFMTRHTCDMRISFVSDKFNYILKSELKTLMGTSFYDLVHPADMKIVTVSMKELFQKGHIRTPYYRLMAANNTLAWVQTEATTINHTTKGQKGQYVICVHSVLGIQGAEESLVVCTDAIPAGMQVDIKKEIDDTKDYIGRQPEIVECVDFTPLIEPEDPFDNVEPVRMVEKDMGPRKNSYDDVLQWLFRDQPSSPPPTRHQFAPITPISPNLEPTLASTQFGLADSPPHPAAALADRISAQCRLHSSPPGVQSGARAYRDAGSISGGSLLRADPARRFSAVPRADRVDVSPVGAIGANGAADLFATMPFADPANETASAQPLAAGAIICDDLQWEEPDLSCLAPFVDTCDMMQMIDEGLPCELQALYDLPDFTPAVPSAPAARPVHIETASPPSKRMQPDDYNMYPPHQTYINFPPPPQDSSSTYWPQAPNNY